MDVHKCVRTYVYVYVYTCICTCMCMCVQPQRKLPGISATEREALPAMEKCPWRGKF